MSARAMALSVSVVLPLLVGGFLPIPLASSAEAQTVSAVVRAEGGASVMLTERYRDRFDWGGGGTLRAGLLFLDDHLEARLSGTTLFFPVEGQVPGTLYQFAAGVRGNLPLDETVGGPFLDLDLGGGVTGELARFVFDVGAGWSFRPADILEIGPFARWTMIVQSEGETVPDHSHLLTFGVDIAIRIPIVSETVTETVREPADRDHDGVLDDNDECPDEAEDADGLADADGCPEDDHDGDGIEDSVDSCPSAPETVNGYLDEDGCPDTEPPPADAPPPEIEPQPLEPRVQFRTGSDNVSARYVEVIREICAIAEQHPSATIRVVGHADETGTVAGNQRLGAARSGAVTEQLILICNLPPARIETYSFGDSRVDCDDAVSRADARECHARNRRAEFFLIEAP